MRRTLMMLTLVVASAAGLAPALAEKHVFIIANNPDGYGVDRCLASGSSCGTAVAAAYCHSQDFADVSSFRRIERDEITGAVPANASFCSGSGCEDYVAIECTR
jgi:hypothetical protein